MRTLLLAAVLAAFAPAAVMRAELTAGDRQRLVAHLEMTGSWLQSEIAGLSETQLKYRATPDSWSVMDVVEHLAVAEAQYWDRVQTSMQQAPWTTKPEATDAAILWYGIDRTNRARTGEARVPTGRWDSVAGSLAVFLKQRAVMLEYAKATKDDLRSRQLLEGNMDVYQWFLMISTHSQRHILQVRELKAGAGFPR